MSQICQITGKKRMTGNNVSHSHRKTKRVFNSNIHTHRIWSPSEEKFIKVKVSKKGLKTIDKNGIDKFIKNYS